MKKIVVLALVIIMVLGTFAGCAQPAAPATEAPATEAPAATATPATNKKADEVIVLRFGTAAKLGEAPFDDPNAWIDNEFCKAVEKNTDGRVKIEYYHSSQLGPEKDLAYAVLQGTLDIATCSNGNFSEFSDVLLFMDLPGLFANTNHMRKVFQSELGDSIKEQIKEQTGCTVLMAFGDAGEPRGIGSQKPVRVPDDTKGLKLRSTGSDIEMALYDNWGAVACPMQATELYVSMQQGVINGCYQQPHIMKINSWNEVVKYFVNNNQSWASKITILGKAAEEKLGSELYQIVVDTAMDYELELDALWEEAKQPAREDFVSHGVEYLEWSDLTAEEQAAWNAKSQEIWSQFVGEGKLISQDIVDQVMALRED